MINLINVSSSFEFMIEYYGSLYPIMTILGYLVNILNFLILGYWLVKSLDIRDKKTVSHDSQLAYYADLHNQGILSDAEFEAKKAEIEQAHTK